MRTVYLLMAATAITPAGCSTLVVSSGQDLHKYTTRDEVHAAFGPPVSTGRSDGQLCEDFVTHSKIAEPYKNAYLWTGYGVTLGLGELVWFPQELYVAGRRSIRGQRLSFTYDATGRVVSVLHDGGVAVGLPPLTPMIPSVPEGTADPPTQSTENLPPKGSE